MQNVTWLPFYSELPPGYDFYCPVVLLLLSGLCGMFFSFVMWFIAVLTYETLYKTRCIYIIGRIFSCCNGDQNYIPLFAKMPIASASDANTAYKTRCIHMISNIFSCCNSIPIFAKMPMVADAGSAGVLLNHISIERMDTQKWMYMDYNRSRTIGYLMSILFILFLSHDVFSSIQSLRLPIAVVFFWASVITFYTIHRKLGDILLDDVMVSFAKRADSVFVEILLEDDYINTRGIGFFGWYFLPPNWIQCQKNVRYEGFGIYRSLTCSLTS